MVQKKVALPAVGAGLIIAGGFAGRRIISGWRRNADPLEGKSAQFPAGTFRLVSTPDGAKIATMTAGVGPAIVCVHGLTASRHDWGPIAPVLIRAGYSVIAIEQRGHGDSTEGTAGYGSTQLGDDLAVVFDELNLDAAALVGHSMGGMAAQAFAVNHPDLFSERVERLVLISTAGSMKTGRHSVGLRIGGVSIPEVIDPADDRLRVGTGLGIFGANPSLHMIDEAIRSFRKCPERVRSDATIALLEHDLLDALAELSLPETLLIGGTRDQLIRPAQIKRLAAAIPNAQLHMLDGAGHMPIWERHEDVSSLIIDFLRE